MIPDIDTRPMADGIPTKPPTFQTKNWGALVRQSWGDDWHKPEIAYRFSNARTFNDSGSTHGVYVPVHPGDAVLQEGGLGKLMQEGGLGAVLME